MKTVTIYDVIQSELINDGHNEFVNDGKLTFFDNKFSFMQKVLQYDEPVHDIVTRLFFNGLTLANDSDDKHFKRAFLLHFMERQINKQTIENFSAQLSYVFMMNQDYLNRVYQDLDKYLTGHSENENQSQVTGSSDNRNASATLPQDTVNLDVYDTVMTAADDNTISRQKNTQDTTGTGITKQYNLDQLRVVNTLLEQVFLKIDKACFLQVW